jgi:hypothetical protein
VTVAHSSEVEPLGDEFPVVYIACPLTGLDERSQLSLGSQVEVIKQAIRSATEDDRPEDDKWPVRTYVPLENSAPWRTEHLTVAEVYRMNVDQVHCADALIVLAENGGSAGVGQELEWSTRLGIPVLYLSPCDVSRQISGTPGVQANTYSFDISTLALLVKNFMRKMRLRIEAGPRKRSSRMMRYEAIRLRLLGAWNSALDKTEIAAQCGLVLESLELTLQESALVAMLPIDMLLNLARSLDVSLDPFVSDIVMLPAPAMRALVRAAEENQWSDTAVERLTVYGLASKAMADPLDLSTMSAWSTLAV